MADIGFNDRRSRPMSASQTMLVRAPVWSAFVGCLIGFGAATWPAWYAWAGQSESAATESSVSSDYENEVVSEADGFRPSGVPKDGSNLPGRSDAAEAVAPSHRAQVDRIKAAVSEALGEPSTSADAVPSRRTVEPVPSRRERLRELVVETPVPDSLKGDQYIDELRDEVSHTIVFRPAARDWATVDDPGVGESVTEQNPATYQVQPGDSLWKIAKDLLGDGYQWTSIYEANRDSLMHKDVLSVGQRLTIPTL
mgnify:CR=1 FL=1